MDIVITVPKTELKNVAKEEAWAKKQDPGVAVCFWKIRGQPKKLEPGDRVYFIHNGVIVNYNIFKHIDWDITCDVTGRLWEGMCLVMDVPSIPLKRPVRMKGSQGFKYIDRIE